MTATLLCGEDGTVVTLDVASWSAEADQLHLRPRGQNVDHL